MMNPTAPSAPLPTPPTNVPPVNIPPVEGAPDSFLSMLAGKRKVQAMQRRRVFDLPGYDGHLGVKLRSADAQAIFKDAAANIGNEGADMTSAEVKELMDARRTLIARATVEVMYRPEGHKPDDSWRPFSEVLNDGLGPVQFDERLCTALDKGDVESATDAVAAVIPHDPNFWDLFMSVVMWFGRENPDEKDELVGESFAAS